MGSRSLNSGDVLRPPGPLSPSGWGPEEGDGSRSGEQGRGDTGLYARGPSVTLVLFSRPHATAWRGIGAWCGLVRGRAATLVLSGVSSRTPWGVSGGVGTVLCPAEVWDDTMGVRDDPHWVV